jgi:hypothetical protein
VAAADSNGGEPHEAASAEPTEPEEVPAPVIHVPDRELGTDDQAEDGDESAPVKKKTRRGSRGGKNRKRKTAAATGAAAAPTLAVADESAPDERPEPEVAEQNGDQDWGYTPMSEWGLDEPE